MQSHIYWESPSKNRCQFEDKLSDTQQTDLIILDFDGTITDAEAEGQAAGRAAVHSALAQVAAQLRVERVARSGGACVRVQKEHLALEQPMPAPAPSKAEERRRRHVDPE